jgi:hypothetical protein
MQTYRRLQSLGIGFLVLYFVVGLASLATPRQEIFPIYSWFLFATVPNQDEKYDVRIYSVGHYKMETPVFYNDGAANIVLDPHSITAYKIIQKMGEAYTRDQMKEFRRYRKLFEKNALWSNTDYEIVKVSYDPIQRWETGKTDVSPLVRLMKP